MGWPKGKSRSPAEMAKRRATIAARKAGTQDQVRADSVKTDPDGLTGMVLDELCIINGTLKSILRELQDINGRDKIQRLKGGAR